MTVLIAIAANPSEGQVPYILMGADSLEITSDPALGTTVKDEQYKKIYKLKDKLVSVSGRFDKIFTDSFLSFLEENDDKLSVLYKKAYEYVYDYMENVEPHEEAKCGIYIGCCNNSTPELAEIRMKKNDIANAFHEYQVPKPNQFIVNFAGSIHVPEDDDLADAFKKRVLDSQSLGLTGVRKAAEDYLKKAASRYPDTCNQNIVFERLR